MVLTIHLNTPPGGRSRIAKNFRSIRPMGIRASPCLTCSVVSPCGARGGILVGHYIVVESPLGGDGGRRSVMPRALSTCRARGEPGVTPVRFSPWTRNVT